MATKEKSGRKLLRFPRRDTVNLSRRAFLGAAETAVGFLLGTVMDSSEKKHRQQVVNGEKET